MNKQVKVLMVEDSEDDAKLALRALRHGGFNPTHRRVQTGTDLKAALAEERWDAVISDFQMPGFSGMDALGIFRSTGLDIPFILVSGTIGEETAVNAMKGGASDYVMKNGLVRLAPALERELKETQSRAEHRVVQQALTDSDKRFRQLAENIRDAFFLLDADTNRVLYISPVYEEISGRSCESVYENPGSWPEAIHPDDQASTYEKYKKGKVAGKFEFQYRIVRPDGAIRWIETRAFPVRDDAGKMVRIAGVAKDVTEHKHHVEALRRSHTAMDATADGIFMVNRTTMRFVEVNASACTMLGYTREELFQMGPTQLGVAPPEQVENVHTPVIAAHVTDELTQTQLRRKDGSHVDVELRGHAQPSGADWIFVAVVRDITERKRAETALRESEAEFRTMAEAMPQLVWIKGPDGSNIYFNQHWMDYTGLTVAESRGHGWNKPFHPEDLLRAQDAWQKATATIGTYSIESRLRRADGVYRWWLVRGVPLQDAAGNILKWFGTCTDIHDLKVAELEIFGTNLALRENEIRIERLNRVYAMLSGINSLIVRVRDRGELFAEACRIAVQSGQFPLAWVAVADPSDQLVKAVAWAGDERGFVQLTRPIVGVKGYGKAGLSAQAIDKCVPVVCNDIEADGSAMRYAKGALERGYRSAAALPLVVDGTAIGTFVLYAKEAGFFDEEEMKLLTELVSNIAFAIDHIDKQERLDYLVYYDALTGLANRSLFLERVAQYARSAVTGEHKLALFLIDLERFKNINDTLGRPVGDALLRQVAEWLTRNVGDANLLARVGADHFAMVVPEVKQEADVARLLEKTMAAFLEHSFRLNDSVFRIAAKVGVALFPDDGADADTLFKNAEAALKKAKASGDRYVFYTQKMTAAVAGKLTLENQLREALDNDEFVLHYQPKVNLQSGKLTGAEALLRWHDPRTGLVPPVRFIPILEETGLIHEVGRWALRKAIADYLRWGAAGLPAVRIAVNVSPLQLRHRGFIAEIEQAIGIDAQAVTGLELEITENMIMEDIKESIASLQAIRAMGVSIAIDDFGTGFSSLGYLSRLPVDTLKIDRSFVIDMTASPQGLALVSTIITLAHSLKLKVVAEGVETEEQARLLRLLNCNEMQGYLFSKPVPCEIFETRFLGAPSVLVASSARLHELSSL